MKADSDPRWARLLGLAVHEFRTPITVVGGYIRMLLKDRAGPITDQQRKLLEEAEKSCGRLSALVAEMSELSALEGGSATLSQSSIDLATLLGEAIAALPILPDREIGVELQTANGGPAAHQGDERRLRAALTAIINAVRREVVNSDRLIVRLTMNGDRQTGSVIAMGEPGQIDTFASADPASLGRFDEWRGGSGLSLAIARRIVTQHGGTLHAPPGGAKAGALLVLPNQR